jgi:hypothetical protein
MTGGACWDVVLATVVTLYQGYRGFMFQWILADKQRWTMAQRVILLCTADTILYLVSSSAGFVALWSGWHLLPRADALLDTSAGAAALLVFLFAFGILGVSGQLPHLLQQGKLAPWSGADKE